MTTRRPKIGYTEQEELRASIPAGELLQMMMCFLNGQEYKGKLIAWNAQQARMASDLLGKCVPSLSNIVLPDTGEDKEQKVSDTPVTDGKKWMDKHKGKVVPIGGDSN